jgi:hypothetical protein
MADQQQKADEKQAQRASTVGVDVNEEQVRTHPGFEKASDQPHPNPHIAGQTPAAETNQPTYVGQTTSSPRSVRPSGRCRRTSSTRTASRPPGASISTRSSSRSRTP